MKKKACILSSLTLILMGCGESRHENARTSVDALPMSPSGETALNKAADSTREPTNTSKHGLKAIYSAANGEVLLTRIDERIDFDWKDGSPDMKVARDHFQVVWEGGIEVPSAGEYEFFTVADDGVKLWLDDGLLIDDWNQHSAREQVSKPKALRAGQRYRLKLQYFENAGLASIRLGWKRPDGEKEIIPVQQLFVSPAQSLCQQVPEQERYFCQLKDGLETQHGISGGSSVFAKGEDEVIGKTLIGGAGNVVNVSGMPFSKAIQLDVHAVPKRPQDSSLNLLNSEALAAGDRVLLVFWARSLTESQAFALGNFMFLLNGSPWTKFKAFEQRVGPEWKQYMLPFEVTQDIPVGGAKFMLEFGVARQSIQIAGVAAINYGKTYETTQLPVASNDGYAGMEADAPWRKEANARIEAHRKADLDVIVRDGQQKPLANAEVRIEMLQHEYAFGTAIQENRIAGNRNQDDTYQDKLLNLDGRGHGFNAVVFENGHKWTQWENNWPLNHADNVKTVQWLVDRNISVRGHTLLWPGYSNLPEHMGKNRDDLGYLREKMEAHVQSMLTNPGLRSIRQWDVLNEPTANVDLANAFRGSSPDYKTGREIYVELFKRARLLRPDIEAYINEAQLTNFYNNSEFYKSIVQEIVDGGAVIDGVGFQAHFRYMIPPEEMLRHYEDYHRMTGGKIRITEYDNATLAPDDLHAAYFRDLLIATFSYPHSDGFLMWGFWEGTSRKAPLFDKNWKLKPSGKPFIDLVFNTWWTPTADLKTDASGKVSLRGFKGRYKITIRQGGKSMEKIVRLNQDLRLVIDLKAEGGTL